MLPFLFFGPLLIVAGALQQLERPAVIEEEITVTATRSDKRIEDEPLRVEVLGREEIEEKALMTPGDIAMLLNETGGLRVQVTSPSLGAANIRIQGLRGRYSQVLSDGLPLYGGQTGAIGLLQIPPLDLGQVEVIKGVASSLYGSSALGGVINLVSRRPETREREMLLNRTSRNGTDAVLWLSDEIRNGWRYSLLGGAHSQLKTDIDHDGWADLPGYGRGVVRPRVYWDNERGSSVFLTAGLMSETRKGGDASFFAEELRTTRLDAGIVGRFLAGDKLVSIRGSIMGQSHRHQFGLVTEEDRHRTFFGEASISGMRGRHTWAAGTAIQSDIYRAQNAVGVDYTYWVPAIFLQDEFAVSSTLTLSASGRFDFHSDYGTFFNPRVAALFKFPRSWTLRLSTGTGTFAPTPFTEETEAVGLSRLHPLAGLEAERAWSASADLGWSGEHVDVHATTFGSVIRNPIDVRVVSSAMDLEIVNASAPTRTGGLEFMTRVHGGPANAVLSYAYTHSTELDHDGNRGFVSLTPRHTVGAVGMIESEDRGRLGVEVFYTGRQRLEDNPFRESSIPYWIIGVLAEHRFGQFRVFVNGENLNNARQTRHDPLRRPRQGADGRWTVDAWAPLEGRVINGGVRVEF